MAAKLKKGDRVIVLAGRDKGKEGEILEVRPAEGRAIVSGVNVVIRHQRPQQGVEGGRITKPSAIQLSNLAMRDPSDGSPTRVGFKILEDGRKVRVAKKSGEVIDG